LSDDDDGSCETDDSREDVRFIGETKQRSRCSRSSRTNRHKAGNSGTEYQSSRKKLSNKTLQSNRDRETDHSRCRWKRDNQLSVDDGGSERRSSRQRQSSVTEGWSASRTSADSCQQPRSNRRIRCSDSGLLSDGESRFTSNSLAQSSGEVSCHYIDIESAESNRRRESRDRPSCPFVFTSGIRSLSPQLDTREYSPNYKPGGLDELICPPAADRETRRRLTEDSCRDFTVRNPLTRSVSPIRGGINAEKLSSCSRLPMNEAVGQRHSQTSGSVPLRHVTSNTDRPSTAFNRPDSADSPPNLAADDSFIDRPVRSFISGDVADSSLVDGRRRSQCSSVDRPSGSLSGMIRSSSNDLRRPPVDDVAAGRHHESSAGSRARHHFYSDCTQCSHCLSYALCSICNSLHSPTNDIHNCLCSPESDALDRDLFLRDDVSDPVSRGRHLSPWSIDRQEFPDGPAAVACRVEDMDLHRFVDQKSAATAEDGGQRSYHAEQSEGGSHTTSLTRLRCLHFYTDCADCPDCCSSSLCGSCCSVHGPLEEPADMSPRCAKRPNDANNNKPSSSSDVINDDPLHVPTGLPVASDGSLTTRGPSDSSGVSPVTAAVSLATKESDADKTTGKESSIHTDKSDSIHSSTSPLEPAAKNLATPGVTKPGLGSVLTSRTKSSDERPGAGEQAQLSSSLAANSDNDECWTVVEKATCGVLVLLILTVFFEIYLQLTRHYFTRKYSV